MSESIGKSLREHVAAADRGAVRILSGGWSIVLTGGPNDRLGQLHQKGPLWLLSGKRIDGRKPTGTSLDFLRRVATGAGAPDDAPLEEVIVGTWSFQWNEPKEVPS